MALDKPLIENTWINYSSVKNDKSFLDKVTSKTYDDNEVPVMYDQVFDDDDFLDKDIGVIDYVLHPLVIAMLLPHRRAYSFFEDYYRHILLFLEYSNPPAATLRFHPTKLMESDMQRQDVAHC